MVHGDDWRKGPQKILEKVIQVLKNGKVSLSRFLIKEYSSNKLTH